MKGIARGVAGLALLVCVASHAAEVHKCIDAEGHVTFSDTSCPDAVVENQSTSSTLSAQPGGASRRQAPAASRDGQPAQPPRGTYGGFIDRGRATPDAARSPDGQKR